MKHYGDITKIDGAAVEPVYVVIGGSPCQDLSVAGKRAGLAGDRSGLFMEQIRLIKEMRKADEHRRIKRSEIHPRYMVWENVPGAFSSNKGEDFRAVLEETIRIVCEEAPAVPQPKNGWTTSGCLCGMDGKWSVAWRVLDAQFYGVPQRRRRIALVADFGGLTAPEILFERESVSGDSQTCRTPWENLAAYAQRSFRTSNRQSNVVYSNNNVLCLNDQGGSVISITNNISGCLRAQEHGHQPIVVSCTNRGQVLSGITETLRSDSHGAIPMLATRSTVYGICSFASNSMLSDNPNSGIYEADTSRTLDMNCGNPACNQGGIVVVTPRTYDARGNGDGETVPTLTGDHESRVTDYSAIVLDDVKCFAQQAFGTYRESDKASSCKSRDYKDATDLVCAVDCRHGTENPDINGTLQAKSTGGQSLNLNNIIRNRYTVRRLTPLECERLQGFPDGWTDIGEWTDSKGKVHKDCADTARYKALGNSIALPPWLYIMQKLSLCCRGDYTMASLFDGIGGFPLIWEYLNGKGTCLWASEIEEFPIAITKYYFSEE